MSEEPEPVPEVEAPAPAKRGGCARPLLVLLLGGLALLLVAGGYALDRWLDSHDRTVDRIADAFLPQETRIVTEWRSEGLPALAADGQLQLATLTQRESLSKHFHIARRFLLDEEWVATATAPVTYRYAVEASPDDWELEVLPDSNRFALVLHAPALVPMQPPAVDTEGLLVSLRAERFSLLDRDAFRDSVTTRLTPMARRRAASPEYIDLARETARKELRRVFLAWLQRANPDALDGLTALHVRFADEPGEAELGSWLGELEPVPPREPASSP